MEVLNKGHPVRGWPAKAGAYLPNVFNVQLVQREKNRRAGIREAKFTVDKDAGSLTTDIENKKGSILPSTGGRGTTMIYIIGAALVVTAGVVLVMRKKMNSDK